MVTEKNGNSLFCKKLINWYNNNKRDLPWRKTTDPYKIWLSEIILQQTRVAQGTDYYLRMIERFPDISSLAAAKEDEVLKYWQGLGYYSRARNLHKAAQTIVNEYNGVMPSDYDQLLTLKGIGEYTAAAISSFSRNAPHAAVDGNVFRFLSRYFGITEAIDTGKGKKLFTEIAENLMDKEHAGTYNQAMMEFGALQCVPGLPDCSSCPFADACIAFSEKKTSAYPVKQNKVKIQNRYFYYFHIVTGPYTYLHKREQKDIWHNLYEFPMIEVQAPLSFDKLQEEPEFRNLFKDSGCLDFRLQISNKKHVLTHRVLWASFYEVALEKPLKASDKWIKITENEIKDYAVHRLMEEYFKLKSK